jgi:tripartite-type tricarboxylate transporter receptor subunit TctC
MDLIASTVTRRRFGQLLGVAPRLGLAASLPARLLGLGGLVTARSALAQEFPNRPISVIVPAPPGGLLDVSMRLVARLVAPHLNNQALVIENRPGASLLLGAEAMARIDKGDGYQLTQSVASWMRVPHLRKVSYDALNDFTHIITLAASPFGVAVRSESPFKTFNDVIAAAREKPGQISYGTVGVGNAGHLLMEEVGRLAGVQWNLVAMKGSVEIIQAVIGGHIDLHSDSTSWAPQVAAGRMRLLAHYGQARLKKYPDVPTFKELGFPIEYLSPFGIAGPKGMDTAVVKTLHDAFRKAMETPEYTDLLEKFELVPMYRNSEQAAADMKETYERERIMITRMGLLGKMQ